MADVFVCHASEDRDAASQMVAALEGAGVSCWIAPRDVVPGADYAQEIIAAIGGARLLLLVLSGASNDSPHVRREVERAVSRDLSILPVRTEQITPSRSLEYYISDAQWFEATSGDVRSHTGDLVTTVRRHLTMDETVVAGGSPPPSDLGPVEGALRQLVDRYGAELGRDPRRVGALLRDLAGERRAEIAAVVAAAEEGVPDALAGASDTMTGATVRRLTEALQEHRALAPAAAEQAVTAWAIALGIRIAEPPAAETPPAEIPEPPPVRTPRRPEPPIDTPSPPARPPTNWRRLAPVFGIGGAIAAGIIVVAVVGGGGSGGPDVTVPTSTTILGTQGTTTTSATSSSTTTTTTTVAGSLATEPVTDSTGSLSTVAPVQWGLSQFNGHIYSATDINTWESEYNERGWKVTATTPGFRLSLFPDDRASDAFMEEVLAGSEVPANCDFATQDSSELGGGYTAWVNTFDCEGGGTYELWAVWEPVVPTYFVVFEAYYETGQELEAIQAAFASSLWVRP